MTTEPIIKIGQRHVRRDGSLTNPLHHYAVRDSVSGDIYDIIGGKRWSNDDASTIICTLQHALETNDKPFGHLHPDLSKAMQEHGGPYEWKWGVADEAFDLLNCLPSWNPDCIYRVAKSAMVQSTVKLADQSLDQFMAAFCKEIEPRLKELAAQIGASVSFKNNAPALDPHRDLGERAALASLQGQCAHPDCINLSTEGIMIWQLIETAPKDGTSIIGFGSYVYEGDKNPTEYIKIIEATGVSKWPWRDSDGMCVDGAYSHWMPFPHPPVQP